MPKKSVLFFLFIPVWLGLASPARAEIVDLGVGTIDLPAGVENQPKRGIDSAVGRLVSHDGTPAVEYDVGTHVPAEAPKKEEVVFFRSGTINEIPWFAAVYHGDPQVLRVVFQREDQGVFWATFASRAERKRALRLILRYSPQADHHQR